MPMDDDRFVDFLQWALPPLGLRWEGFRKVYGQVEKRVRDRMVELQIRSLSAYRQRLEEEAAEWDQLEAMCRITISRFYRDADIFNLLRVEILSALARRAERAERDRYPASTLEELPDGLSAFEPWDGRASVFRYCGE